MSAEFQLASSQKNQAPETAPDKTKVRINPLIIKTNPFSIGDMIWIGEKEKKIIDKDLHNSFPLEPSVDTVLP